MITTDRAIMIVWFTPSRIVGLRERELHLAQQLTRACDRTTRPASTISFGTWRIPRFVSRIPTGRA